MMVIIPRVLALACAVGTAHGASGAADAGAVGRPGLASLPQEIRSGALPLPRAAAARRAVSARCMILTAAGDGASGQRARAAEEPGRARQAHCSALRAPAYAGGPLPACGRNEPRAVNSRGRPSERRPAPAAAICRQPAGEVSGVCRAVGTTRVSAHLGNPPDKLPGAARGADTKCRRPFCPLVRAAPAS